MKRKLTTAFLTATLLATAALSEMPASFTYRGRVSQASTGEAVSKELPVTFKLYAKASSAEPLWGVTVQVLLGSNGMFQVELADGLAATYLTTNALAAVLQAGAARFVGVTVGAGQAEQYPRQSLLFEPFVEQAAVAGALIDGGTLSDVAVTDLSTSSLSVKSTSTITGGLRATGASRSLALSSCTAGENSQLSIRSSGAFSIFASHSPQESTMYAPAQGTTYRAPGSGGVLCVLTQNNWDIPCLCVPLGSYETFSFPRPCSGNVRLLFYPYGTSN